MKVVCIKDTITKHDSKANPKLVNDLGETSSYGDECVRLLTKAEEREERLKELGI